MKIIAFVFAIIAVLNITSYSQEVYTQSEPHKYETNCKDDVDYYSITDKKHNIKVYSFIDCNMSGVVSIGFSVANHHDSLRSKKNYDTKNVAFFKYYDSVFNIKRIKNQYEVENPENALNILIPHIEQIIPMNDTIIILIGISSTGYSLIKNIILVNIKDKIKILNTVTYRLVEKDYNVNETEVICFNVIPEKRTLIFGENENNISYGLMFQKNDNDEFMRILPQKNIPKIELNSRKIYYKIHNSAKIPLKINDESYFIVKY